MMIMNRAIGEGGGGRRGERCRQWWIGMDPKEVEDERKEMG